jgi:hypothetical protein
MQVITKNNCPVIPAKAGIQFFFALREGPELDSRLRGNDAEEVVR